MSDISEEDKLSFLSTQSSPTLSPRKPIATSAWEEELSRSLSRLAILKFDDVSFMETDESVQGPNVQLPGYDTLLEEGESVQHTPGQDNLPTEGEVEGAPGENVNNPVLDLASQQTQSRGNQRNNDPPDDENPDNNSDPTPDNIQLLDMGTKGIKIPEFDPADPKSADAKAWVYLTENARAGGGTQTINGRDVFVISDTDLASKAFGALRGDAASWAAILAEEQADPYPLRTWATFKTAFLERFHVKPTVSAISRQLKELVQKPDESVLTFLDRVKKVILELVDLEWTDENDAPAKRKFKDIVTKHYFINGLQDVIAGRMLDQGPTTLNEVITIAQRVEVSLKETGKLKISMAALELTDSNQSNKEPNSEVLAINYSARRGNTRGRRGRQFGNRNYRNMGQRQGSGNAGGRSNQRNGDKCSFCSRFGHRREFCWINPDSPSYKGQQQGPKPSSQMAQLDHENPEVSAVHFNEGIMQALNRFAE